MKESLDRPLRPDTLPDDTAAAFDLPALVDELLQEASGIEAGRSAAALVAHADMRMVLTAFRAGSGLAEHRAPGAVVITCLMGRIVCTAAGDVTELEQGGAIAFRPGALHSVHAPTDSAILITIAGAERSPAS